MLHGRQIAAARALLEMSQSTLAKASKVSVPTIKRMEAATGAAPGIPNNLSAIRAALEAAGAIFLDEGAIVAGGPGVRLQKAHEKSNREP